MQPNIHNLSTPLGAQGNPFIERSVIDPYTGQAYTYFMGQGDMNQFDPSLGQAITSNLPQSNYARQTNAPGWDTQYKAESERLQQAVAQNRAAAERFLSGNQQPRALPQYNDITGAFIGDPANDPRNQQQGNQDMAGATYNWMNNKQPTNGLTMPGRQFGRGTVGMQQPASTQQANGSWMGAQDGFGRSLMPTGWYQAPSNQGMTPTNPMGQYGQQYGQSFGYPGDASQSLPSSDWGSPDYAEQPAAGGGMGGSGRPNQGQVPGSGGGRSFGRMTPGGGQPHVTMQTPQGAAQGGSQMGGMAPPLYYNGGFQGGGLGNAGSYPGLTGGIPQTSSGFSGGQSFGGGSQQSFGQSFQQGQPQQYQFGTVNGVPFGQAPPANVMSGIPGYGGYGGGYQQQQMQPSPWGGGGGTATMGGLAAPIFAPGTNIGGRQDAFGRPVTQSGGGGWQAIRGGYSTQPWGNLVR